MFIFNDTDEPIEFTNKRWSSSIVVPPRGHKEVTGMKAKRILASEQFRLAQAAEEVRVAEYYFEEAT